MLEDPFFDLIDPVLAPLGQLPEDGEEFREPPLDVLRYYRRPVRLHWLPLLGRAQSVVAVARQPADVGVAGGPGKDLGAFLARVAMAAGGGSNSGSQFFFTIDPGPLQGGTYPIIGSVSDGQDVVEKINGFSDASEQPTKEIVIESVTIEES